MIIKTLIFTCLISIAIAYYALVATSLPLFFELFFQFIPQLVASAILPQLWWIIPAIAAITAIVFALMHVKCFCDFYDDITEQNFSIKKSIFALVSIFIAWFLAQEFLEHLTISIIANYLPYNALLGITFFAACFSLIFFLQRGFDNIKNLELKSKHILPGIILLAFLTIALNTIIIIPSPIVTIASIIALTTIGLSAILFILTVATADNKLTKIEKLGKEFIEKFALICHCAAEAMLAGKGALIATKNILWAVLVIITKMLHEILVDMVDHHTDGNNHDYANHADNHKNDSHNHDLTNPQVISIVLLFVTLYLFPLLNIAYPYFWAMCSTFVCFSILNIYDTSTGKHDDNSSTLKTGIFFIALGAIGAVAGVEASLIFNIGFIPILFATFVSILTEGNVVHEVFAHDNSSKTSISQPHKGNELYQNTYKKPEPTQNTWAELGFKSVYDRL